MEFWKGGIGCWLLAYQISTAGGNQGTGTPSDIFLLKMQQEIHFKELKALFHFIVC